MTAYRRSTGLQTKLTLIFLLLVCLMVVAFLSVALRVVQFAEQRAFEARAASIAGLLAADISNISASDILFSQTRFLLRNVRSQPQVRYVYMYDYGGTILADGSDTAGLVNTVPSDRIHLNAVSNEKTLLPLLQYREPDFL